MLDGTVTYLATGGATHSATVLTDATTLSTVSLYWTTGGTPSTTPTDLASHTITATVSVTAVAPK
jgi:hypothetical protein